MPLLRKDKVPISGILHYSVGKIIPAICGIVILSLGMRILGSKGYGEFILVSNCITLLATFSTGWIQQGFLRFAGVDEKHPLAIDKSRFLKLKYLSASIIFILQFFISIFYFNYNLKFTIPLAIIAILYNNLQIDLSFLQSRNLSLRYAITDTLSTSIGTVIGLLLIYFWPSKEPRLLLIGLGIGYLINILLNFRHSFIGSKDIPYDNFFKEFLNFGYQISIWLGISYMFNIVDRFLIKQFLGYAESGLYSAVYDLIYKLSSLMCMPILLAYHPLITKAWNNGQIKESGRLIRTAIKIELLLLLLLSLFFTFFSDTFFRLILGNNNLSNLKWIYPLIFSSMLWQIAMFLHKPLELNMKLKLMLFSIIVSLFVNVLLNILLIPTYGFVASAWITFFCTIIYIFCVSIFSKTIKVNA